MAEATTQAGVVLAAGGIVVRPGREGVDAQTLVIHRPRHDDWSFPKGKLDPGESFESAAVREVREETALQCGLLDEVTSEQDVVEYTQEGGVKRTRYWLMAVEAEERFTPNDEVDACRWVTFEEAAAVVTDPLDRALAERALSVLLG